MRRASWLLLLLLPLVAGAGLSSYGCVAIPKVAAHGVVSGYAVSGPVDSAWARDYLEGRPLPPALEETRQLYLSARRVPSRDALAALSQTYSPDVATLLFIETMSARHQASGLRQRYEAELMWVRKVGVERARPPVPERLHVLLVPGWFYRSHGAETNSDYAVQRRLLARWGFPHQLIAVEENGTVEANARIVADAVRAAPPGHQLLLVSASKSGAEVALALGRELAPAETQAVVGWLSIVGVVRGSPLADRVLEPDLCWLAQLKFGLEGFDLEGARSMMTLRGRLAFDLLRFPEHIRIFEYVAVPLSGHISSRGAFGYARMRDLGPNDGLTLLADELLPGAVPLLDPGTDHFLGHEDPELWSAALFRVFSAEVSRPLRAATINPAPAAATLRRW